MFDLPLDVSIMYVADRNDFVTSNLFWQVIVLLDWAALALYGTPVFNI